MIVLNDTLGAVGGSHTLFLRMCEWYKKNSYSVSFFCNNRDNEEIAMQLEKMGVTIYVIDTANIKNTYRLLNKIDDGDICVINFWWNMYLNIEAVKKRYRIRIDNMIYLIHPKCLIKGDSYKQTSMLSGMIINRYKRIIPEMCKNNAIVSMDEINIEETESYYGIELLPPPQIIRLPMIVEPVDKDRVIRTGYDGRIIMTSCRADFPYKGYVVGLVEQFIALKKDYPDIKLNIICDGDDIDILKQRIQEVSDPYKDDIMLSGWMNYNELKEQMNNCFVYVGMGSSVLDSSLHYKPSIVVKFYTMDCIGRDFTADNPFDLAARDDIVTTTSDAIKSVLSMSFEEYWRLSIRSFDVVKDIYGIDNVMSQFMNEKNTSQKSILRVGDYLLISSNNMVNHIRFKNRDQKSSVKHLRIKKDE